MPFRVAGARPWRRALAAKLAYWRAIGDDANWRVTLERAIGVREGVRPPGMTVAQARLFDAGHSHGTFLTNEFGFTLARKHATALRACALLLAFGIPAVAFAAGMRNAGIAAVGGGACASSDCLPSAGCSSPKPGTRFGFITAMHGPDTTLR